MVILSDDSQDMPARPDGPADDSFQRTMGRSRATYLELLTQAPSVGDLEPRVRLNLQQSLLQFVKDETKWLALPTVEQRRLLKRLTNRLGQTMYFAETITLPCPNDRGELVPTQVSILLDLTRNEHLSRIFSQIISSKIATVFHQEFCFGLLEMIDSLIAIEERALSFQDMELPEGFLFFKLFPEGNTGLLPFSLQDLQVVQQSRVGIQVDLIPRFLRSPLNRLYHVISSSCRDFPSLALYFYIERFFSTPVWRGRPEPSQQREEYIRTLLGKSFYAVVRSGGLTLEELERPQAPRLSWFDYLTEGDDSSTRLDLEKAKQAQQDRYDTLQERLEIISQIDHSVVTQRRALHGPLTLVELTYDQILSDAINFCREQELSVEGEDSDPNVVWLPFPSAHPENLDQEAVLSYLNEVTHETSLTRLPGGECDLIRRWDLLVEAVTLDPTLNKQLEALGESPRRLKQDLILLLADRHRELVSQNTETILSIISSNVSRMMHLGTVTPDVVVKRRYSLLQEKLLPFVYYVADREGETWQTSPYPFGTLLFAIQKAKERKDADGPLSAQLLEALARIEWQNLNC